MKPHKKQIKKINHILSLHPIKKHHEHHNKQPTIRITNLYILYILNNTTNYTTPTYKHLLHS